MARIVGVDLPLQKRAEIGLTYIYGIGRVRSNTIGRRVNVQDSGSSVGLKHTLSSHA